MEFQQEKRDLGDTPPPPYASGTVQAPPLQQQGVIQEQPQVQRVILMSGARYTGIHDTKPLIFAALLSVCVAFCGCWWSLLCTLTALCLAVYQLSAAHNGKTEASIVSRNVSYGLSCLGFVFAAIPGIIILAIIIFSDGDRDD